MLCVFLDCLSYPFSFLWRLFVLCLVCLSVLCLVWPMLCVFLDCLFLITPSVFSNVYLSCVLCDQCCVCLWIVYSWIPLQFSLTLICPVSCVTNVVLFLDCLFLITPSVFSNVYLSCVLCDQCCVCFWIVYSWLPHRFSLTFICPVSCVTDVVYVSGLSILDYPFSFL